MTTLAEVILQTLRDRAVIPDFADGERDESVLEAMYASGAIDRSQVLRTLGAEFAMEVLLPGTDWNADPECLHSLDPELAETRQILPIRIEGEQLMVAISNPLEFDSLDDLAHASGLAVEPLLADADELREAIRRAYAKGPGGPDTTTDAGISVEIEEITGADVASTLGIDFEESVSPGDQGPIVRFVEKLISEALRRRASDIHLEPMERRFRVRFRIDGRLREIENPPKRLQPSILSRIKLMAGISIAEKRIPQDGRIRIHTGGKDIDLRVSSLPSVYGETVVMRILDREGLRLGLPELGFFNDDQQKFEQLVSMPDGIFLVTGPTGSGKSTTLYAVLNHLNKADRKIITVEDPVEYQLSGINQVQVRREVGMDFAAALRAMLRQAPNIIMVGEIRDRETAEIAINASLTGHMVFSTLHTNDAPSAVSRLIDIGVKPFLVSASLRAVLAQRLVRLVCAECRENYPAEERELRGLGLDPLQSAGSTFSRGTGCLRCGGTGYFGRKGIFELMEIDESIQQMIYQHSSLVDLRRSARERGMRTMREDGIRKIIAGITTPEEVLAVTVALSE